MVFPGGRKLDESCLILQIKILPVFGNNSLLVVPNELLRVRKMQRQRNLSQVDPFCSVVVSSITSRPWVFLLRQNFFEFQVQKHRANSLLYLIYYLSDTFWSKF